MIKGEMKRHTRAEFQYTVSYGILLQDWRESRYLPCIGS